jgi:hypothetical protein
MVPKKTLQLKYFMNGQQAVRLIDRLLDRDQQRKLNDIQSKIVLQIWEGDTYRSIGDRLSYDLDYIKQIAARLWKLLSQLLSENICKSNIKSVLERCQESMPVSDWDDLSDGAETDLQTIETWMISDHMTTIAFFSSSENPKTPQSIELDSPQERLPVISVAVCEASASASVRQRQVQEEIQSLIWQNLHKPFIPNVLMNEILSVLTVRNPDKNSVNCLIVNCYFDR